MDKKNYSGEVTGLQIWCSNCREPHVIRTENLVLAAARGEKKLTTFVCNELMAAAMAIALAARVADSRNQPAKSPFIRTYDLGDLNKLFENGDNFPFNLNLSI